MTHVVNLDALPNRCPRPELRAGCRTDPFWMRLWGGGSQASWTSRAQLERLADAGAVKLQRRDVAYDRAEARAILLDQSRQHRSLRTEGLAALGALFQHRTLTTEQVESITGVVHRRTSRNTIGRGGLGLGFAAGLLERGEFSVGPGRVAGELPNIWRPALASKSGWLVNELSYPEWVNVTGGQHLTFGSQFDRHNLTNAEFLLRAAEMCPTVAAVTGEAMAHVPTVANVPDPGRVGAFADGVLVRSDGLRICVESQNSRAHLSLKGKIERWVHRLAETETLDEGGVVVLFLDVSDTRLGSGVLTVTRQVIEEVLDGYPWTLARQIDHRIALARWVDYFPEGPGQVDRSTFPCLQALRPTGTGEGRWEPASLLNTASVTFEPQKRGDWTTAITNLAGMWGTPFWLRDAADQIDWGRYLFERHTEDHPILRAQLGAYKGYGHRKGATTAKARR